MKNIIQESVQASIQVKKSILLDDEFLQRIEEAVNSILLAFQQGKRIYFCGNGGSAADAQHLAAEFSGRFYKNRRALPAEALHCNTSYLTAVANDFGYDEIYARIVEGILEPGDVLIGLSTSGNSPNIVKAFESARLRSITTIGFTGRKGGQLAALSDLLFNVPSDDTPRIQESHIMVGHIICQLVEAKFFA
ncbi:D-sedoheptulose 7-phosphate isomerase [Flavihumibacter sp. RY-1]|uniref:Phosphoheptose isomerase n=1 Tax=Flavihumibacter fluminis TaxID=2909236 RepID=A0ABS9BDB7_9BACT|nr:D-sedoheptulose 7-phosphate isomerase [Flavihumibacter fluminis]MCF1713077.1 D-sedoheptulose 7-phosphate isomerase [Flavihumibacter fluminis]